MIGRLKTVMVESFEKVLEPRLLNYYAVSGLSGQTLYAREFSFQRNILAGEGIQESFHCQESAVPSAGFREKSGFNASATRTHAVFPITVHSRKLTLGTYDAQWLR